LFFFLLLLEPEFLQKPVSPDGHFRGVFSDLGLGLYISPSNS